MRLSTSILLLNPSIAFSVTICFLSVPAPYMLNWITSFWPVSLRSFSVVASLSSLNLQVGCPVKAYCQNGKEWSSMCQKKYRPPARKNVSWLVYKRGSGRPKKWSEFRDASKSADQRSTCHTTVAPLWPVVTPPDGTSASGIWYQVEVSWRQ